VVEVEMGTCKASLGLLVEESGRLGVGEGRCEPVAVESGRLGMVLGEGKCELVAVEEMSNVVVVSRLVVVMVSRLVVAERNKSMVLLKFQMGN
jgi:hypothetical protein